MTYRVEIRLSAQSPLRATGEGVVGGLNLIGALATLAILVSQFPFAVARNQGRIAPCSRKD